MLKQWEHVTGLGLAFAGTSVAATFGSEAGVVVAYALAVALGVVVYLQGDRSATAATVTGNILLGYLAGIALSLAAATALFIWYLNLPVDFGAWQMGLRLWDSWAGLGAAALSGFFLAGIGALLY